MPHWIWAVAFPLILTFSLGEKEQPFIGLLKWVRQKAGVRRDHYEKLRVFLPLPKGEGRGEGGGNFTSLGRLRFKLNRSSPP